MLFNLQFARHCMCTTVTRAITLMQFPNCITTYGQLTEIGPNDGIKSKRMALGQNKCIYVKNILLYEKYQILCAAHANCITVVSH